jgi:hypothetical protein
MIEASNTEDRRGDSQLIAIDDANNVLLSSERKLD